VECFYRRVQWRQNPQDAGVTTRSGYETAFEKVSLHLCGVAFEAQPQQASAAEDLPHGADLERVLSDCTELRGALHQAFVGDRIQHCQQGGTCQRPTAKRRPQITGLDAFADGLAHQHRAHGNPIGHPFR